MLYNNAFRVSVKRVPFWRVYPSMETFLSQIYEGEMKHCIVSGHFEESFCSVSRR